MNDQPLNDGELDAKIRSLVATAVADSRAPRPLPALDSAMASVVPLRPTRRRRVWVGAAASVAAALVAVAVWAGGDSEPTISPATTAPSVAWPDDVVVIIADGSERVQRLTATSAGDGALGFFGPAPVELAFELADGTLVTDADSTQGRLLDVAQNGEVLRLTDQRNLIALTPDGDSRVVGGFSGPVPVDWCSFAGALAFLCKAGPDSGISDGIPLPDPSKATSYSPAALTWSGDALVAALNGLAQRWTVDGLQSSVELPQPLGWTFVDASDDVAVFSRDDGPGVLVDFRDGTIHPLPVAGTATISFNTGVATTPTTTTPDTIATTVTPEPVVLSSTVVTAGPDGVWRLVDGVATQLTAEAMSMALQLPDGSVIMQRSSGWSSEGAVHADTTLLIWQFGELNELFPGEALDGWVRLYDVAMVNGEMTVLYAIEQEAQPFSVLVESVLETRSLATWETTMIDAEFGGWERGYSRMHLAENGLIVGESYQEVTHGLRSYSLPGGEPVTADQLGLESAYSDCSDCPRLYTVRRDGNIVAWLDGTTLHLATPGLTAAEQFDLGDAALEATDLELGIGFVVLSFGWNDPGAAAPVVIDFNIGSTSAVELPGVKAAAVSIPTAPWEIDEDLTAALQRQSFGLQDELYEAVEEQIEAIRYSAVEQVEPIIFTHSAPPDGSLVIAAPNFDDSVPQTWYRIVLEGPDSLTIDHIESVAVCRNFTYSTPTHRCV